MAAAAGSRRSGGAQVVQADITNPRILGPVFEGCDAAYFAIPTAPDRVKMGKAFVDACFEFGCRHAVLVSVAGADRKETAFQRQFAEIEEYALGKKGRPVKVKLADRGHMKFAPIIVRSCPFYQTFYTSIAAISTAKTLYYPLGIEGALTHTDVDDVGRAIAAILTEPAKHNGEVYTIVGETHAGNQLASQIGMKAGIQCRYETVEDEIAVAAWKALGLADWIAEGNVETIAWLRGGNGTGLGAGDYERITGSKPARFGDFVKSSLRPLIN